MTPNTMDYDTGYRERITERLSELRAARERLLPDQDDPEVLSELTAVAGLITDLERTLNNRGRRLSLAAISDHRCLAPFLSPTILTFGGDSSDADGLGHDARVEGAPGVFS